MCQLENSERPAARCALLLCVVPKADVNLELCAPKDISISMLIVYVRSNILLLVDGVFIGSAQAKEIDSAGMIGLNSLATIWWLAVAVVDISFAVCYQCC